MADFLITCRITAPDGLLEQSIALGKIAPDIQKFAGDLSAAMGSPVKVEIRPIRRERGSVAPADKPERKPRKPRGSAAGAAGNDLLGSGGVPEHKVYSIGTSTGEHKDHHDRLLAKSMAEPMEGG